MSDSNSDSDNSSDSDLDSELDSYNLLIESARSGDLERCNSLIKILPIFTNNFFYEL